MKPRHDKKIAIMASYKSLQAGRPKKDSHFSYSSERMTRLTGSEAAGAPRRNKDSAVLSVRQNQEPAERSGQRRTEGEEEEVSQATVSTDLQINTEALSKLQVKQNKKLSVKLKLLVSFTGDNRSSKGFPEISRDEKHPEVEAE